MEHTLYEYSLGIALVLMLFFAVYFLTAKTLAVNGLPSLLIAEGKEAQKLDLYDFLEKSTASHQRPVVSFCNEKRIKSSPTRNALATLCSLFLWHDIC